MDPELRQNAMETVFTFYRVRMAFLKMLKVRGYITGPFEVTLDQYTQQFGSIFRVQEETSGLILQREESHRHHKEDDTIIGFICAEKKIGVGTAIQIVNTMKEKGVYHSILIYRSGITPKASETFEKGKSSGLLVETFSYEEVMIDVYGNLPYKTVDRVIINAEEEQKLIEKYGGKDAFPSILKGDPKTKYLGLKLGDMLKVTMPSDTGGVYSQYLVCRYNHQVEDIFSSKHRKK
uniref:DNA-directed RNA polymerase subunit 5 n=1 Tax=Clandestinovirus TaxID=2831644 RepID=A0A8F8KNE0_9VIRU|nr:DNA-directed RNA polymerase subunit 5 [Clandestinovirus]